jgi:hypothetical protein
MLHQDKFDEFCDKVTQMCEGITTNARKMYDQKTSGGMDFILYMDSSTIADAIHHAFEPAAIRSRSRYGSIVEFQVQKLDESDSILTQEGLEAAHRKIFDNLHTSVMNESGRLGKCLDRVSKSTSKSKEEIKEIIECKISELRDEFNSKATYPEKNQTLLQLREFYNTIRDDATLENLITENDNSMRPR